MDFEELIDLVNEDKFDEFCGKFFQFIRSVDERGDVLSGEAGLVELAFEQLIWGPHGRRSVQSMLSEQSAVVGPCGAVWTASSDFCYHCVDCGADDTCALCVDCWVPELHQGHRYRLVRTGGGMCDCGDDTAWSVDSMCPKHRPVAPEPGSAGDREAAGSPLDQVDSVMASDAALIRNLSTTSEAANVVSNATVTAQGGASQVDADSEFALPPQFGRYAFVVLAALWRRAATKLTRGGGIARNMTSNQGTESSPGGRMEQFASSDEGSDGDQPDATLPPSWPPGSDARKQERRRRRRRRQFGLRNSPAIRLLASATTRACEQLGPRFVRLVALVLLSPLTTDGRSPQPPAAATNPPFLSHFDEKLLNQFDETLRSSILDALVVRFHLPFRSARRLLRDLFCRLVGDSLFKRNLGRVLALEYKSTEALERAREARVKARGAAGVQPESSGDDLQFQRLDALAAGADPAASSNVRGTAEADDAISVVGLGVQVFTVPPIALTSVRHHQVLQSQIDLIGHCLGRRHPLVDDARARAHFIGGSGEEGGNGIGVPPEATPIADRQRLELAGTLDTTVEALKSHSYWRTGVDVRYILVNPVVAQHAIYVRSEFEQWLLTMAKLHNADPNYHTLQHAEFESFISEPAFSFVLTCHRIDICWERGFAAGPRPLLPLTTSASQFTPPFTTNGPGDRVALVDADLDDVRRVLGLAKRVAVDAATEGTRFVDQELQRVGQPTAEAGWSRPLVPGGLLSGRVAVSFHSPVTRLFSRLALIAHRQWSNVLNCFVALREKPANDAQQATVALCNEVACLFEPALRLYALRSQIRARLWTRNGMHLLEQMSLYESSQFSLDRRDDLFLVQISAAWFTELGQGVQFVRQAADRFGVAGFFTLVQRDVVMAAAGGGDSAAIVNRRTVPWWSRLPGLEVSELPPSGDLSSESATQVMKVAVQLAQDYLFFLLVVLLDGTRSALLTPDELCELEICAWLGLQPMPFSEIENHVTKWVRRCEQFPQLVKKCAALSGTAGTMTATSSSRKFALRPEYWQRVCPYYGVYSREQAQAVEQRLEDERARRQRNGDPSSLSVLPQLLAGDGVDQNDLRDRLISLLDLPETLHLTFVVLFYAWRQNALKYSEQLTVRALHLLSLAIQLAIRKCQQKTPPSGSKDDHQSVEISAPVPLPLDAECVYASVTNGSGDESLGTWRRLFCRFQLPSTTETVSIISLLQRVVRSADPGSIVRVNALAVVELLASSDTATVQPRLAALAASILEEHNAGRPPFDVDLLFDSSSNSLGGDGACQDHHDMSVTQKGTLDAEDSSPTAEGKKKKKKNKKSAAEKRRAAIMARFKSQQQTFLKQQGQEADGIQESAGAGSTSTATAVASFPTSPDGGGTETESAAAELDGLPRRFSDSKSRFHSTSACDSSKMDENTDDSLQNVCVVCRDGTVPAGLIVRVACGQILCASRRATLIDESRHDRRVTRPRRRRHASSDSRNKMQVDAADSLGSSPSSSIDHSVVEALDRAAREHQQREEQRRLEEEQEEGRNHSESEEDDEEGDEEDQNSGDEDDLDDGFLDLNGLLDDDIRDQLMRMLGMAGLNGDEGDDDDNNDNNDDDDDDGGGEDNAVDDDDDDDDNNAGDDGDDAQLGRLNRRNRVGLPGLIHIHDDDDDDNADNGGVRGAVEVPGGPPTGSSSNSSRREDSGHSVSHLIENSRSWVWKALAAPLDNGGTAEEDLLKVVSAWRRGDRESAVDGSFFFAHVPKLTVPKLTPALVLSCGHRMHHQCWQTHMQGLQRTRSRFRRPSSRDDFACPLCKWPANGVMSDNHQSIGDVIDVVADGSTAAEQTLESSASPEAWLTIVQLVCAEPKATPLPAGPGTNSVIAPFLRMLSASDGTRGLGQAAAVSPAARQLLSLRFEGCRAAAALVAVMELRQRTMAAYREMQDHRVLDQPSSRWGPNELCSFFLESRSRVPSCTVLRRLASLGALGIDNVAVADGLLQSVLRPFVVGTTMTGLESTDKVDDSTWKQLVCLDPASLFVRLVIVASASSLATRVVGSASRLHGFVGRLPESIVHSLLMMCYSLACAQAAIYDPPSDGGWSVAQPGDSRSARHVGSATSDGNGKRRKLADDHGSECDEELSDGHREHGAAKHARREGKAKERANDPETSAGGAVGCATDAFPVAGLSGFELRLVPFVRQAFLFLTVGLGVDQLANGSLHSDQSNDEEEGDDDRGRTVVDDYLDRLALPRPDRLSGPFAWLSETIAKFGSEINQKMGAVRRPILASCLPVFAASLKLPPLLHDQRFFLRLSRAPCTLCGRVQTGNRSIDTALCLECGASICFTKDGACAVQHASLAHGQKTESWLFILRDTRIWFVRGMAVHALATPYVDSQAESDVNMKRGVPLFRDDDCFRLLLDAWLSGDGISLVRRR